MLVSSCPDSQSVNGETEVSAVLSRCEAPLEGSRLRSGVGAGLVQV